MTAVAMIPADVVRRYAEAKGEERIRLERAYPELGTRVHAHTYEPWSQEEADSLRRTSNAMMYHDDFHNSGHGGDNSRLARENCSACVLLGYEPRGGFGDGYSVKEHGPNYAGWARAYLQARRAMPDSWREAFAAQGREAGTQPNDAYFHAIGRDLVTFGPPTYYTGRR